MSKGLECKRELDQFSIIHEYLKSIRFSFLGNLFYFLASMVEAEALQKGKYKNYIRLNLIIFGSLFMGSYLFINGNLYKPFLITYLRRKVI